MSGGRAYADRHPEARSESQWGQFGYVSRQLRAAIRALTQDARLPAGGRVLDYGCADQPYRSELGAGVEYVGADIPGNTAADLELVDGRVPANDETFDLVLSTQVLEHVEEPAVHLRECLRVLRPGGSVVLSTHGVMYYHRDPEDYWRWTKPGLVKLLTDNGLEVVEVRGILGLAPAALQIFQDATLWKVPAPLRRPYTRMMQALIAFTDRRYDEVNRVENCLTLAVRATKPLS